MGGSYCHETNQLPMLRAQYLQCLGNEIIRVHFTFSGGLEIIRKLARTWVSGVSIGLRHLRIIEVPASTASRMGRAAAIALAGL